MRKMESIEREDKEEIFVIRRFPEDYKTAHIISSKIKLVGSFAKRYLIEYLNLTGGKSDFEIIVIDFSVFKYYLALKGFKIYSPPKKSLSRTSEAIYIGRSREKSEGLLLQYLPPNSHTSLHYHKTRTEFYHSIEGEAILCCGKKEFILKPPITREVLPETPHQTITKDFPALILLEIVNDPEMSMEDHYYLD